MSKQREQVENVQISEEELKRRLTPTQYQVTREGATEPAFTGIYWDAKDEGVYRCIVCDSPLFSSDTKYESGTGWPSFWEPITEDAVRFEDDSGFGMRRTEVLCNHCDAHLGHVFNDGPQPTGLRYCMNSAALNLENGEDADE